MTAAGALRPELQDINANPHLLIAMPTFANALGAAGFVVATEAHGRHAREKEPTLLPLVPDRATDLLVVGKGRDHEALVQRLSARQLLSVKVDVVVISV